MIPRVEDGDPACVVPGTREAPIDLLDSDGASPPNMDDCLSTVRNLFPDISRDYAEGLCRTRFGQPQSRENHMSNVESVVVDVLDNLPYPKEKKVLKRKRTDDDEDDKAWKNNTHAGDMLYAAISRVPLFPLPMLYSTC